MSAGWPVKTSVGFAGSVAAEEDVEGVCWGLGVILPVHAGSVRGGKAHAAQACAKVAAIDRLYFASSLLPNEVNESFDQESVGRRENAWRWESNDLKPEIALVIFEMPWRISDRSFWMRRVHAVREALRIVLYGASCFCSFKW